VKHFVSALFELNYTCVYENFMKIVVRWIFDSQIWVNYECTTGMCILLNTIYPPKPKVRLSQHAIYQPPLISNIEVTKITSTVNSLETQIQTMQICKLIIQNSIIQLSIQNRS